MKRVVYVVSGVTRSKEYEWLCDHWDRSRQDLSFILLNKVADCPLQGSIRQRGFSCETIIHNGKKDLLGSCLQLVRKFRRLRPDVVNGNLLEGSFLGLLAAIWCRVPLRINTRHHSTHNFKYHPTRGVLYDRLIDRMAHRIISISSGVSKVLTEMEHVPPEKIILIPHGFPLKEAHAARSIAIEVLRSKYYLDGTGPIIGVIARPFDWKGLDDVITAFGALLDRHKKAKLLIFNWDDTPFSGGFLARLEEFPKDRWRTVRFEPDIMQCFHLFDVFVHVPEDPLAEAFGLVYIEALLTGVPCVFTASGVLNDIRPADLPGVSMVPFKAPGAIADACSAFFKDPPDQEQRNLWAQQHVQQLAPTLSIEKRVARLHDLYDGIQDGIR